MGTVLQMQWYGRFQHARYLSNHLLCNRSAGNEARTSVRTINVVDSQAPVITLIGDSNITHEAGPEYVDAGAEWNDAVDGNGTADANGTVNSQVPGIYLITYTYTDQQWQPCGSSHPDD